MDVSEKVAIVTGGGRGIGRAIALSMAQNGADVAVGDINLQDAQSVASEVDGVDRRSLGSHVDVTDQDSVESMVRAVIDGFGRIDILVNNAGIIGAAGWEEREVPDEGDWDAIYEVNVKGMQRMTYAVVDHMKERRYGKIVNIASISGRIGTLTSLPYGVSKSGVINMTQGLALELAPFSINVNAICPGILWTSMWERIAYRWSIDPEKSEGLTPREIFDRTIKERIPLGREQTPEDIGHLAAFLASDLAKNITGQAINVSGGSHMN